MQDWVKVYERDCTASKLQEMQFLVKTQKLHQYL